MTKCDKCGAVIPEDDTPWEFKGKFYCEKCADESEYHEAMERENRRQWWSDLLWAIRHPIATAHWELQKRGWFRKPSPSDDDIPF
jgi:hypothetical protein